jgi:hypothetical protein
MRMRRITLSFVARPVSTFVARPVSTFCHKTHHFLKIKNVIEHKVRVLISLATLV